MTSYPKGDRSTSRRASRPRKRKFHGNRFTTKDNEDFDANASAKKLSTASCEDIIANPLHCYRIIEFLTVFHAITDIVICRLCKQSIKFEECGHRGLGFKIVLSCKCGRREINSGPLLNTGYEINRRIVFVMRLLSISREGINVFCGLMDLCQGLAKSTYDQIVQHLHSASKSMFKNVSKKAVKEEREKNVANGRIETHLKVTGDGSWKKRGFTSLCGVTTLIAYYSGKVIDLIVKSAYCHACVLSKKSLDDDEFEEWHENHKESCSSNHEGSAEKMEIDPIMEMFLRSEEKFDVKYTNYIGYGKAKNFSGILKTNPYGDDCPVTISECVGQNSNESFNSTVWRINPKHLHSGQKIVEIAAYLAAGILNEGYSAILNTMQLLDLNIGYQCKMFADTADAQLIKKGNRNYSLSTKVAHTARRLEQMHQNELFEEAEGLLYELEIAD